MENTTMTMTPTTKSIDARLGMPICGQAFGARAATTASAYAIKGQLGRIVDVPTVPGTHAWSPPIS